MNEFLVTFRRRYSQQAHRMIPAASPRGGLRIVARDKAVDRRIAHAALGQVWVFGSPASIDDVRWNRLYPLADIARIGFYLTTTAVGVWS